MKSLIAALRTLVLPWGRTSGRRIILDGVNGDIRIYDLLGDLRIRMGWEGNPDAIYLYPPSAITTADEAHAGRLNSVFYGAAGTTRRVGLEVASPDVVTAARDRAFLEVVSESEDGTIPPRVDIYSDNNRADVRLNARSLPRGWLTTLASTGASPALAAIGGVQTLPGTSYTIVNNTGMTRRYKVTASARFNMSAGAVGLYRPLVTNGATAAIGPGTTQVQTTSTGGPGQVGGHDFAIVTVNHGASLTVGAGGLRASGGGAADVITTGELTVEDIGTT